MYPSAVSQPPRSLKEQRPACWASRLHNRNRVRRTADSPTHDTVKRADASSEDSALGELEAAAGLHAPVLLALDGTAVAGQEPAFLERPAQVRLEVGERLRDAVTHRAGLARKASAGDRCGDVVLVLAVGGCDRL